MISACISLNCINCNKEGYRIEDEGNVESPDNEELMIPFSIQSMHESFNNTENIKINKSLRKKKNSQRSFVLNSTINSFCDNKIYAKNDLFNQGNNRRRRRSTFTLCPNSKIDKKHLDSSLYPFCSICIFLNEAISKKIELKNTEFFLFQEIISEINLEKSKTINLQKECQKFKKLNLDEGKNKKVNELITNNEKLNKDFLMIEELKNRRKSELNEEIKKLNIKLLESQKELKNSKNNISNSVKRNDNEKQYFHKEKSDIEKLLINEINSINLIKKMIHKNTAKINNQSHTISEMNRMVNHVINK